MSCSQQLPKDHPLVLAWEVYKKAEEYSNTRNWAAYEAHVDGSLWASFSAGWNAAGAYAEGLRVKVERLGKELEIENTRLAACGVVAMSDTPESAARNRDMLPEYRSASCDDVARRVDECMSLRAERDALRAEVEGLRSMPANKTLARLAECYLKRPVEVAKACDEMIDRSGNLLGWIRDAARGKA